MTPVHVPLRARCVSSLNEKRASAHSNDFCASGHTVPPTGDHTKIETPTHKSENTRLGRQRYPLPRMLCPGLVNDISDLPDRCAHDIY